MLKTDDDKTTNLHKFEFWWNIIECEKTMKKN